MKKVTIIAFLLFFLTCSVFAQHDVAKFGKVTDNELDMNVYEPDSSASAVILFDDGISEILYNESKEQFEIKFSRHVRIKILTKDGLDRANFSIPLYSSQGMKEDLMRVRGFTFNKQDGKTERERLRPSDVIDEVSSDRLTYKKFTLPKVVAGSVIDVTYDISSDYLFNLQDWNFQHTIPCMLSRYKTVIPEYYNYRNNLTGYENVKIDKTASQRNIIYSYRTEERSGVLKVADSHRHQGSITYSVDITDYIAENVPALPNESFVDNRSNYTTRIDFELLSYRFPGGSQRQFSANWDNIVRELLDHSSFGGQLSGTRYLRDDVQALVDGSESTEEQLKAVFDFVRQKISWNERYRLFTTDGARQAWRNGSGNSSEININLINALRELGFEAMPVVLSTRSNGRILPHQVTITGFNHVIALVVKDGNRYLIDATSDYPDPFILPTECLNDKGRIVDMSANDWIQLDNAVTSRAITIINSAIDENMNLTGSVNTLHSNYRAAHIYRQNKTAKDQEEFLEKLKKQYGNAEIIVNEAAIDEENSSHYNADLAFTSRNAAIVSGNMIYLDPLIGFEFDLNPFRQPTRKLPVNFTYPQEIQYSNRISIPEGYELEELPENLGIALPKGDCRFLFSASVMNNEIIINARLMLNRIIFPPEEYPDIKAFFDAVIKKQEEKLTLKKT